MKYLTIALLLPLFSACSTLAVGGHQSLAIATDPMAESCKLANTRDIVSFVPPTTVVMPRSMSDLMLNCTDTATNTHGRMVVHSEFEPHAWMNVFSLGLGMLVDWSTGAAYQYPEKIYLTLDTPLNPALPITASTIPIVQVTPIPAPMHEFTP